eukprot:TRINITY_DN11205_c0_g1_i1.p3 TRINITY_DN11205_c0_g1~~TRINITY_DN11205_c0_g1_i1.p3  ORF type:complete len:127 (-),score=25.96 TRINITY_DN11205_c0_g1_i1:86-466(-)
MLLLTDRFDGSQVYSWGRNTLGQLGHNQPPSQTPIRVEGLRVAVADICAGDYHSLALTESMEIWAWGSGEWGQLGVMNGKDGQGNVYVPQEIEISKKKKYLWRSIAAGPFCSAAVAMTGEVFVWEK